jgi:hypothetical protein
MTSLSHTFERITGVHPDRGSIPVWAGFIGAPFLWSMHLLLLYMMVPWFCATGRNWVGHLLTALFIAVGLWFTYLCWREWRHVGGGEPSSDEPPANGRTRFAAVVGMMSSALFTLVIAAEHIPAFMLSPCWN